jgi:hypothetical protein
MKYFVLLLNILLLVSCESKKENSEQTQIAQENQTVISTACAIVISPTRKQTDSLKKVLGEERFYSVLDDNIFYTAEAVTKLDSLHLKIIYKKAEGNLKFKLAKGEVITIDLSKYTWEILLFNGQTSPVSADRTNIEADFKKIEK